MLITLEKFAKTMHYVMHQAEISPRGMEKLRGKFGQQYKCTEGVAPLSVPSNRFIGGPDSVRQWDEDKPVSEHLHTIMGQLYRWLPILQP